MRHWSLAPWAAALTLFSSAALAGTAPGPMQPLPPSSAAQEQLADQLKTRGLKYYGSWRCPACQYQGRLFGATAVERLPYVECAQPKTLPEQAQACIAADIEAYPTWIHPSGERRIGVQSLEALKLWMTQP